MIQLPFIWLLRPTLILSLILISPAPLLADTPSQDSEQSEEQDSKYEPPQAYVTEAFALSAAQAQEIQDSYTTAVWVDDKLDQTLNETFGLSSRLTSVYQDVFPFPDLHTNLGPHVSQMMISYSAILLLARNGYMYAAEREITQFLKAFLRFNTALDFHLPSQSTFTTRNFLNETEREIVIERVFSELDAIGDAFSSQPQTHEQRNRIRMNLTELSYNLMESDFQSELKALEQEYLNQGIPTVLTVISAFLGGFAAFVFGIMSLDQSFGVEFSDISPWVGIPLFMVAMVVMGTTGAEASAGFMRAVLRPFNYWHARVEHIRAVVRSCSRALRSPGRPPR